MMQTEVHEFAGHLLDMDGTLIDSTPAISRFWTAFAEETGISPETVMEASHGRRAIDTIGLFDESKANWDCEAPVPAHVRCRDMGDGMLHPCSQRC